MGEARPVRLQLSRRKGFNLQALSMATNGLPAVKVDRTFIFGNPFLVKKAAEAGYKDAAAMAVHAFRQWLSGDAEWRRGDNDVERELILVNLGSLTGKNLACWCKPEEPCHADVLLELACSPGDAP